jgi:uncharacterized protein YoxC
MKKQRHPDCRLPLRFVLLTQTTIDKTKRQLDEANKKNKILATNVSRLSRELESSKKHQKTIETDMQSKDVR